MHSRLSQFLRYGGHGEAVLTRTDQGQPGLRLALSLKSQFPDHPALRDSFAERLDAAIRANTAMLLSAAEGHYRPPLTEPEIPGVSAARAETLAEWERRIEVIWTEWHAHPQRLRPIREAMEAHLLRAFAAMINELRQRGLGIRQYVWRTRDDVKVRSTHAAHDDQVFS